MTKPLALALLMAASSLLAGHAIAQPWGGGSQDEDYPEGWGDDDRRNHGREEEYRPPIYWDEAPGEPQARGERLFRQAMLKAHNDARRAVGQPPLRWNMELSADASRYARILARTRTFRHSTEPRGRQPQGENLWMGSSRRFGYDEMTGSWVKERRWFRRAAMPKVSSTGRWADVGHYTQIIWHSTTDVGCAMADNGKDEYLVCRYSPPGNVYGRNPLGGDEPPAPRRTGW